MNPSELPESVQCGDVVSTRLIITCSGNFANGGIGEIIIVSDYMNDAKFNRGGHNVYDISRTIEEYAKANPDSEVANVYAIMCELSDMIYDRGPSAPNREAFSRAKAIASSSLTRLAGDNAFVRTDTGRSLMKSLKSLSDGLHRAGPSSVDSYAMPASSLMKNIEFP